MSRYSICPFTERKSSYAHAAMAAYSFGDRRSGTCFFPLSVSAISVQTSRIYDGLRVAVAAEHNEKV